jgi:hypothetical protein
VYRDEVDTAVGIPAAPVAFASTEFAAIDESDTVALEPPTSAPAEPVMVTPLFAESVVVATETKPAVLLPYMSCDEVKVVCPVPPLDTESVPVVSPIAIPSEEVANWIQVLPGPPMRSDDEAMVERPVPPFPPGSVPVTSAARLMSEVPTTPAVARRTPVKFAIESVFETLRFEVEANEEMVRSEVVAFDAVRFVVVPVETERFAIDDEARMLIPSVVVGVSAPFAISNALPKSCVVSAYAERSEKVGRPRDEVASC